MHVLISCINTATIRTFPSHPSLPEAGLKRGEGGGEAISTLFHISNSHWLIDFPVAALLHSGENITMYPPRGDEQTR